MGEVFKPVKFEWRGDEYVLPARQVLETLGKIEDVLTLRDLIEIRRSGSPPLAKLAQAFAIALQDAGAQVTPDDVYQGIFADALHDGAELMLTVIGMLYTLMVPPSEMGGDAAPGKSRPAAGESSRSSTRQRSARDGARRRNSGG